MRMNDNITKDNLTRRYIGALALIAFLSLSTFIIIHNLIKAQEYTAAVINISGRQRMLSQRAVALAVQMVHESSASEKEKLKEKLLQTASLMEESHLYLLNGNPALHLPGNPSDEIQKMYFAPPLMVDNTIKTFVGTIKSFAQTPGMAYSQADASYRLIVSQGQEVVPKALNAIVSQYQLETDKKVAKLLKIETGIVAIVFLILLMEGILIFRPLIAKILRDRESLAQANERLEKLSAIDGLTNIPNRRSFDDFIAREWQRALRNKRSIAVIMIDIDFFKAYNDTYGHMAGDQCLKTVAGILAGYAKRPTDMVARYGGEEFVAILGDTDLKGAMLIGEQMRSGIETLKMENIHSKVKNTVTISAGAAAMIPTRETPYQALMEAADQALYQAKQEGRNRIKSAVAKR